MLPWVGLRRVRLGRPLSPGQGPKEALGVGFERQGLADRPGPAETGDCSMALGPLAESLGREETNLAAEDTACCQIQGPAWARDHHPDPKSREVVVRRKSCLEGTGVGKHQRREAYFGLAVHHHALEPCRIRQYIIDEYVQVNLRRRALPIRRKATEISTWYVCAFRQRQCFYIRNISSL